VRRHYVRLNPFQPGDPLPVDDAGRLALTVNNRAEGLDRSYPAREIVDAGFLELVRYGIRAADYATIRDSIRVVDATLKVDTPSGTGLAPLQQRRIRAARGRRTFHGCR